MLKKKKEHPIKKPKIHPRSKHRDRYDLQQLKTSFPDLAEFIRPNPYGDESIDFANSGAVKALNTALLLHFYDIQHWTIPEGYLCPPIPGRADYIHHVADLLSESHQKEVGENKTIHCLDIGVGASCIYPIIGVKEYGWTFTGTDIDPNAIESAQHIIDADTLLKDQVSIRLQPNAKNVLRGIIKPDDHFDLSICNPPFHASAEEAAAGTRRKIKNLSGEKTKQPTLNFGGKQSELWCEGGEIRFVRTLILESKHHASSCRWFTTLISKEANLEAVYNALKQVNATEVRTIDMGQGNKISRIVAWTFAEKKQTD